MGGATITTEPPNNPYLLPTNHNLHVGFGRLPGLSSTWKHRSYSAFYITAPRKRFWAPAQFAWCTIRVPAGDFKHPNVYSVVQGVLSGERPNGVSGAERLQKTVRNVFRAPARDYGHLNSLCRAIQLSGDLEAFQRPQVGSKNILMPTRTIWALESRLPVTSIL